MLGVLTWTIGFLAVSVLTCQGIRLPSNCVNDCVYELTWQKNATHTAFKFSAQMKNNLIQSQNFWCAFAFSKDSKMVKIAYF